MAKIRDIIGDNKVWRSVDETTDAKGRQIANAIVGTLQPDKESQIFLINTQQLERTNSTTVSQFKISNGIKFENIILLVTDAAAFMKKCAQSLKVMYPNKIYLTC